MSAIVTSLLYITIGLALAGLVGRALSRSGRAFLRTKFGGQDGVADAVDRLLVVAFYLLAAGFIALTVPTGAHLADGGQALRLLSVKLGELLLVLGALHLASTITFARLRGSRTSAMLPAAEDPEFPGGPGAGADDLGISDSRASDSRASGSGISGSGISGSGISGSGISDSGISDSGISDSGISDSGIGASARDRFGPAGRLAPRPLTSASAASRIATAPVATARTHGARTQTARPATASTASARAAAARAAIAPAAASGLGVTPTSPGPWRPRRAAH